MLVLPALLGSTGARAMSFDVVNVGTDVNCRHGCTEVITAQGEITNDSAGEFLSFLSSHLRDHSLRPFVLIGSPGGTVLGAMKLGAVFRRIGAAVMVAAARGSDDSSSLRLSAADCLSACVYAFMGGAKRLVPTVSRLGIHRMVIDQHNESFFGSDEGERRIYGSPEFVAALSSYTRSMGVDPNVIAYAERIPPEAIHILSRSEIRRWRLGATVNR